LGETGVKTAEAAGNEAMLAVLGKHVNSRNAAAIRDMIRKGQYPEDRTENPLEAEVEPKPSQQDPMPPQQEGAAAEGAENAEAGHKEQSQEPESAKADDMSARLAEKDAEIERLKRELAKVERQFKAIQSAITPTQQENARLRKELAELKARESSSAAQQVSGQPGRKPNWEDIERVFPEGAAELKYAYEQNQALLKRLEELERRLGGGAEQPPKPQLSQAEEDVRAMAVEFVLRAHPDAREISKDPGFIEWVNSHGEAAREMWALLAEPWMTPTAPAVVAEYFAAYKRDKAAQPVSSQNQPAQQAQPQRQQKPTRPPDIAPDVRSQTHVGREPNSDNQGARLLSDAEWEALNRELRKNTTPLQRKIEIRNLMREQFALAQRLRAQRRAQPFS